MQAADLTKKIRFAVWAALAVLAIGISAEAQSSASQASPAAFDKQLWLTDFQELIAALDTHYADLDWAIRDRHMDLPNLRRTTQDKLLTATDSHTAQVALEEFLDAFGDGHLSIEWPRENAAQASTHTMPVSPLCSRLGYRTPNKKGIEFSALPSFVTVADSNELPGGIIPLHGGSVGVIRIANFNEHGFPEACENTIREMGLSDTSACDGNCARAVALATTNHLTEAIVRRAHQLQTLGATKLLVDLTHNDGGDDWNEAVARSLASVPLVDQRRGFIKYGSWTAKLERDLGSVQRDLDNNKEPKAVLKQAAAQLENAIAQSKQPCDRSSAFETGTVNCALVGQGLFWSGVLPYAKPGSFPDLESRTIIFNPLQYQYIEGANKLPLLVAVDAHSWSSAERFAALLQDNHAATIVGELTGGAGCGFVDGGIPTTLSHSHARVNIPNCVGLRADGSNANDGVIPDVLVPWARRDTSFTRVDKMRVALERSSVSVR